MAGRLTAVLLLVAALALVAACGVFVAAEFALLAADRPTVERLAAGGDRRARGTLAALRTLSTQLSGVQVGITVTNLAIGLLAEPALATLLEGPLRAAGLSGEVVPSVAVTVGLIVSTLLTMLIGELLPKNLAIAIPIRVAGVVQAPVRAFSRALAWPIRWLNALAEAVLLRFGIEPTEELSSARSADELLAVVRRSGAEGALEADTARLLTRSLLYGRRRAADAMTPRPNLHTVRADETAADVLAAALSTGFSRFPVVGRDADDLLGLVTVKDALRVPRADRARTRVDALAVEAVLVPSSLPLDDVVDALRERGAHLAVVVDEYGGTAGIVTLEDLAEELIGEVADEFDADAGPSIVAEDGSWLVPGALGPSDVAGTIGRPVPSGPWSTVAGMVLGHLHRLAGVGDAVTVAGTRWTVLETDGRRIVALRAEAVDPPDA